MRRGSARTVRASDVATTDGRLRPGLGWEWRRRPAAPPPRRRLGMKRPTRVSLPYMNLTFLGRTARRGGTISPLCLVSCVSACWYRCMATSWTPQRYIRGGLVGGRSRRESDSVMGMGRVAQLSRVRPHLQRPRQSLTPPSTACRCTRAQLFVARLCEDAGTASERQYSKIETRLVTVHTEASSGHEQHNHKPPLGRQHHVAVLHPAQRRRRKRRQGPPLGTSPLSPLLLPRHIECLYYFLLSARRS